MALFKKDTIIIYDEIESQELCGVDGYGRPKKCVVETQTILGDLQPKRTQEIDQEFGETKQDEYILFLPYTAEITDTCKVMVEGYNGFFQVQGGPKRFNGLIPHLEVTLIQEMG